jgi:hypothetical protein
MNDTESISKRRCQHPRSSRRANQGEGTDWDLNRASGWPLSNDDIKLKIFHRRVQHLFNHSWQAMDFVDKEYISVRKRRKDGGQISRTFDCRSRGPLKTNSKLGGDNSRERSLSQARRPVQQNVIKRLPTPLRRVTRYL